MFAKPGIPSTDLEARLPQSADHIQQRTTTPAGPPHRVFRQALVFFPVRVTVANRSLPQQHLCARGDHGGSTRYIGEQQPQKKRIVGQDTSVCFPRAPFGTSTTDRQPSLQGGLSP